MLGKGGGFGDLIKGISSHHFNLFIDFAWMHCDRKSQLF